MTDRDRLIELLYQKQWQGNSIETGINYIENSTLADYLLDNGVILPPCKVGDVVWVVFSPKYPANPNDKGKWFMQQDGVQRIIWGAKGLSIETWNMGTIPAKELGKKIFLTKEDAEEKLRVMFNG